MSKLYLYVLHNKQFDENLMSMVAIVTDLKSSKLVRIGTVESPLGVSVINMKRMLKFPESKYLSLDGLCIKVNLLEESNKVKTSGDVVFLDTKHDAEIQSLDINNHLLILKNISKLDHSLLQEDYDPSLQKSKHSIALVLGTNFKVYNKQFSSGYNPIKLDFKIHGGDYLRDLTIIDKAFQDQRSFDHIEHAIVLIESPNSHIQFNGNSESKRYRFVSKVIPFNLSEIKIPDHNHEMLEIYKYDIKKQQLILKNKKGEYSFYNLKE